MNRPIALLVLAVAAAGCAAKGAKAEKKPEAAPITFPHSPHVEGDVPCLDCHAGIEKATKLDPKVRHIHIPAKAEICSGCHDTIPKFQVPARADRHFTVNFDHAAHLPRVKNDCKACHKVLPEPGMEELPVPPMAACTACHNHQDDFARAKCRPCHVDLKEYALKPVTVFAHQGEWLLNHGTYARPSAESCAACHDQTYCAECHSATTTPARPSILFPEEVTREFIHRGDYISRHTVDVAAFPASCRRCHGSAFCEACHTLQGLTSAAQNVRDPHPRGWANDRASGNFHGDAARRNIVNCAGCHDQGANAVCVACHTLGGPGGTPHPAGWGSRHDRNDCQHNRMCQVCHTPACNIP